MKRRTIPTLCRLLPLLWALPLLGCAPEPRPAAPTRAARPAPPAACAWTGDATARAIVETLAEAQRAYLERGDTKPFLALVLPDAEIRAARASSPGRFDFAFSKKQLDDIYRWGAANDGPFSAELTTVRAVATPDSANVEVRLDCSKPTGERAAFGQRFGLGCHGGSWRIERFRYWPLEPDTGREFGPFFDETDAQIEREIEAGDLRHAAYHLMLAYRFNECAALARRLTAETPDDAWAWGLRAKASALVGDRSDAEQALRLASSLAAGAP